MKTDHFIFRKKYWWCNWKDYANRKNNICCPYCSKQTVEFYFPAKGSDSVVDHFLDNGKAYCIARHNDCGNYIPMDA